MHIMGDQYRMSIAATREELAELGAFFTGLAAAPGNAVSCKFSIGGVSPGSLPTRFHVDVSDRPEKEK